MTDGPGPDAPSAGGPSGDAPAGPTRRRGLTIAIVAALVLVPLAIVGVMVFAGSGEEATQYVIDVPAGTGDRIDAGENVVLMPPELELNVGDQLLVNNEDDQIHTVGPFTVRPGESLLQVFSEPGVIEGACTLNPDQGVRIVVT